MKQKASTKAKISIDDFEAVKEQFLFDVKVVVEMEEIPHDLIINCDQTGIHYITVGSWTMEKEGAKRENYIQCQHLGESMCVSFF